MKNVKKKVLIVSQYYYPEQFQINEIATELVKRGYDVTVLCGLPNYPKGILFDGYRTVEESKEREQENFEKTGVQVIHVDQVPRGHNLLKLVMNYYSYMKNSKKAIRELPADFDVVFGYQLSPITSMYAALEYKKLYGAPILYYTLDIWPVSAESMLKSKRNPLYAFAAKISREIYQEANRILLTSRPFIDYLNKANGVEVSKMGYLPQHAGTEMLNMELTSEDNSIADFLFAGNFGKGQRLDVIVNAAAVLGARKDYKIHMVGDGRMRETLEQMVREKGLQDNFIFYGNQKRQDMPSFYKKADALLITLRGNNEVGNTMPGKLQMYMTTGKPIFGAINGAAQEVIKESKCGSCVNACDHEGLAKMMLLFIEHPENYTEAGGNARKFFKANFTLKRYTDGLCKELDALVKR
ncbi:glycosyltransferase family 4 protein [uncultured Bacteroides sp.]|uniref:glycosyltransferase family 4 protein n=1 Tax=uncultured Bacteroides sp. TaxID=162156 RepID=UPI002AA6B7F9|nr:glycosyltransferase family 4 protein [uncultured Bacteroides sp.]